MHLDEKSRELIIQDELRSWFKQGSATSLELLPETVQGDLEELFACKPQGFREIILTVVMATFLDSSYKASRDFYACNPRPVYEGGIRPVLRELRVPCGQSGPLNVAKATRALDASWAAQRRPASAGAATLGVVKFLEDHPEEYESLATALVYLFSKEADKVDEIQSTSKPTVGLAPLIKLCLGLIEKAPDRGNTAQRVCGYILEQVISDPSLCVSGTTDSASTTNATSNKPGDLCVFDSRERVRLIFEITTKKFSVQRISECSQSLWAYIRKVGQDSEQIDQDVYTVRVLCFPENAPDTGGEPSGKMGDLGSVYSDGFQYEFFDISIWIASNLYGLASSERRGFFKNLQIYINQTTTSMPVKIAFKELITGIED
jgi:hypothetical protein